MLTIEQIQALPAFNAQLELEEEMRAGGIKRFRDQLEKARDDGAASGVGAARRMVVQLHDTVAKGISDFIAAASSGKAGRKHASLKMFEEVGDIDLMAHLALRYCLDCGVSRPTLQRLALPLASAIEDEMLFRAFKAEEKQKYDWQMEKMATKGNDRYRRKSTRITAEKIGIVHPLAWDERSKLLLGSKLLEIVIETTGIVQISRVSKPDGTTPNYIELTPETIAWIEKENGSIEWLSPTYKPCIVPPKPWSTPFDGGYWSGRVRRLTLVKTPNRPYLQSLAGVAMPQVYSAVNALQNTAWNINSRVLAVMMEIWEKSLNIDVIPKADPDEPPAKPFWLVEGLKVEDMTEAQQREFKQWKVEAHRVADDNALAKLGRMEFLRMTNVAKEYEGKDFWYPYNLDFRGRIYPVGLYLHPQGSDAARGLLEFANTCPIGSAAGALWLAVHGAGLWGVDKVSLEDRQQWVFDHEEQILAVALDPLSNLFWAEAEKPWQALAFCFDWLGYRTEGFTYESSLPVQMDGTCNGLQNFSAILRDPIGGAAVNLIPADKPQDIYQLVADVVSKRIERDAISGAVFPAKEGQEPVKVADVALGWVGRVNRKVTKRPVMTLAYGAKQFGFKEQVFTDTIKPMKKEMGESFPWGKNTWKAADYMGGLIWDCVGDVVVAARDAMDWLQEAAKVAASEGLPINWVTPTGFPVQQAYRVSSSKKIEMTFSKVRLVASISKNEEKIDGRKQASSIAPNWVHSLDSAHLQRTVNAAHEAGMRSFSFIHDSFGTHAGNAPGLADILREEFVRMYSETCVLSDFRDYLAEQLSTPEMLPPLPQKGTLDLQLVLESPFFFA